MARISVEQAVNFEPDKHNVISERVEDNGLLVDEVISEILARYCEGLDRIVEDAKKVLHNSRHLSDGELEYYILTIPVELYSISDLEQSIGVREDVANMIRKRMYIDARQAATGTIEDKNAQAEKEVMQETLTATAYGRASKALKAKKEAGFEILSAFKKVLSKRMEEYQLNRFGGDN